MKQIIRLMMLSLAAALVLSCALPYGRSTGYRYVQNPAEQRAILRANYPHLYNYYAEGVLQIVSMKEKIYARLLINADKFAAHIAAEF